MKILASTCFLILLNAANAFAQSGHTDVNIAHNWNHLDRDLELSVERFFNKNGLRLGMHYFQNTAEAHLDWQDKPRATTFGERFGFGLSYLRYLPLAHSSVELYPYLKLTGFNLRYQTQSEADGLSSEPSRWKFYSGIGIQVKSKLYRRLYLTASADAGARWEKFDVYYDKYFNGINTTASVGLAYRLKP